MLPKSRRLDRILMMACFLQPAASAIWEMVSPSLKAILFKGMLKMATESQ